MSNVGAEMDSVLAQLQDNHNRAAATVADTWFAPFVGGKEAAEGTLYVSRRTIDSLNEWKTRVLAGTMTFTEWLRIANGDNDTLRSLVATLPKLSTSGVVEGAWGDFKEDATTALKFGSAGLLGAGLLALVALFLWQKGTR